MSIYSHLPPEHRAVVASALQGHPLESLVIQCVGENDIQMLKAIKAAGRFAFGMEEMTYPGGPASPVLNGDALPLIDALGLVMGKWLSTRASFDTWKTSPSGAPIKVDFYVSRNNASQELRDLVGEVCQGALKRMTSLTADLSETDDESAFYRVRAGTLSAILAMACVIDDSALLGLALEFMGARSPNDSFYVISRQHVNLEFEPITFAIRGNCLEAITAYQKRNPDFLSGRLGRTKNGPTSSWKHLFLPDILNLLDFPPTPEMMRFILQGIKGADGSFDPQHHDWLTGAFTHRVLAENWTHLSQVAMEEGVFKLKPADSCFEAATYACVPLMRHLLEDSELELAAVKTEGGLTVFSPRHPIPVLCDDETWKSRHEVESTLLMVLNEMENRGMLNDVFLAQYKNGKQLLTERLLKKDLMKPLLFLINRGLDLDQEHHAGTLEQQAAAAGQEQPLHLLRSALARREAFGALDSLKPSISP